MLEIRRVAINDIYCDPANTRTHDQKNLSAIRDSLKQFGQVEPLVIQKSTGKVVGGNGRLEVMRELGHQEADIVEIDLDDVQAAALSITLNRTAEFADWDLKALAKTIEGLKAEDFDINLLGWEQHELEPLLSAEWSPPAVEGDLENDFKDKEETIKVSPEQLDAIKEAADIMEETHGNKLPLGVVAAEACREYVKVKRG